MTPVKTKSTKTATDKSKSKKKLEFDENTNNNNIMEEEHGDDWHLNDQEHLFYRSNYAPEDNIRPVLKVNRFIEYVTYKSEALIN